ncbi:MAG: hypothetical protein V1846_02755 [Candidatus Komeilibacteria bacterium]
MRKIFTIAIVTFFLLTGCNILADGENKVVDFEKPSIKDEFCGAYINFQYCKCAFHGQYCKEVGMSKSEANKYVQDEYEKWLNNGTRLTFITDCEKANAYFSDDKCHYCDEGFTAVPKEKTCKPSSEVPNILTDLPEDLFNTDCTLVKDKYDSDWKKYSDIDNAIPVTERSNEAQQVVASYDTMIAKMVELYETQRDYDIEAQLQTDLTEYKQALVKNIQTNLLKAFWRLSYVTYSTVKSGITAGKSYSNLLTGAGSAVQSLASAGKTFQATIPNSSDLAIDKSTYLGKAESVGAKTALEAVESLGDPSKIAQRLAKSSFDAVMPSANITKEEVEILKQQQINKGVVDQALADSKAENSARQAKITQLEADIKAAEAKITEWEGKEKERVADLIIQDCQRQINKTN